MSTASGAVRIDWVGDDQGFVALEDEWEALTATAADPFADHAWFHCWWEAFGSGSRLRVAVARGGDGALLGALPLAARRGRLAALANYHSPVFRPAALDAATLKELAAAAVAGGPLHIHALPAADAALDAVREAARAQRRLLHVEPAHRSPIVATTGGAEEYLAGRPSTLRRRRRKLAREHEVTFRLDDGGDDLDADLDRGFAVEAAGWKGEAGTAISSAGETERFYRALAHAYRARDGLRVGWLLVDGRPAAWSFCLLRARRLYMLKTGYDEALRASAPGLMLHLLTVERCFAEGLEAYELLGEAERWKLDLANDGRDHVRLWARPRNPAGVARHVARARLLPLARRVLRRDG